MGKHHKASFTAAAAPAGAAGAAGALPALPGAITVDGSQLEGGGQILRNAVALAAITRTPVTIHSIRAGRSKPGLSPQHLTGLRLVEQMCGGALAGGAPRSTEIAFKPGLLAAGRYLADTQTAGSCTLMVQQALPCMLFAAPPPGASTAAAAGSESAAAGAAVGCSAGAAAAAAADDDCTAAAGGAAHGWSQLDLRGGTDAAFAPPIGYLQHVLAPTLAALLPPGSGLQISLQQRGFYPRGGGRALVRARALAPGGRLPPIDVSRRGKLVEVRLLAFSAGKVPHSDAQRMAAAAAGALQDALAGSRGSTIIHGCGEGPAAEPAAAAVAAASTQAAPHTAAAAPTAAAAAPSTAAGEPSASIAAAAVAAAGGSSGGGSAFGGVSILQEVTREGEATAVGDGGGLLLVARSDAGRLWGASVAWERGVPPGSAGKAAAEELVEVLASGACVDGWMQDQLIVWMALAAGTSRMICGEPSLHTRTAIAVASQLLPAARFKVTLLPHSGGCGGAGSAMSGDGGGGGSGKRSGGSGGGSGGSGGGGSGSEGSQLYLVECQGAGIAA